MAFLAEWKSKRKLATICHRILGKGTTIVEGRGWIGWDRSRETSDASPL